MPYLPQSLVRGVPYLPQRFARQGLQACGRSGHWPIGRLVRGGYVQVFISDFFEYLKIYFATPRARNTVRRIRTIDRMHNIKCPTPKGNERLSLAVVLSLFICVHETLLLPIPRKPSSVIPQHRKRAICVWSSILLTVLLCK